MAKADILRALRRHIQAMGATIDEGRGRLTGKIEDNEKVELAARLAGLIEQRDELTKKLNGWEALSDDRWSNLETQIGIEWQYLVQDLEERWGRLE